MFCYRTFSQSCGGPGKGSFQLSSVHAEALDNVVILLAKLPLADPADFAGERKCMHCAGCGVVPKNSSWL